MSTIYSSKGFSSLPGYNFRNRLGWAARVTVGATLCVVLAQVPVTQKAVLPAIPYFAAIMAIFCVDENLGKTISNAFYCSVGSLVPALLVPIIHILFGSSSVATYVALGLLTFSLAYVTIGPLKAPLGKRLCLAVNAILLIALNSNPALVATFPLQMALTISVGALCGVMALLLPFPKLALTEAHALVAHATLCTSSAFSILLESYSAQTDERASYLTVQAAMVMRTGREDLSLLRLRHADLWWEPRWRRREHLESICKFIAVVGELTEYCTALQTAMREWEILSALNNPLKDRMSAVLRKVGHSSAAALQRVARQASGRGGPENSAEEERGWVENLRVFEGELQKAREATYYKDGLYRAYLGELEGESPYRSAQAYGGWWQAMQPFYQQRYGVEAAHTVQGLLQGNTSIPSLQAKEWLDTLLAAEKSAAGPRGDVYSLEPGHSPIPCFTVSIFFLFNADRYVRVALDAADVAGFGLDMAGRASRQSVSEGDGEGEGEGEGEGMLEIGEGGGERFLSLRLSSTATRREVVEGGLEGMEEDREGTGGGVEAGGSTVPSAATASEVRQGGGSRWRSAAQSLMAIAGGLISIPAMKDGVKRSISVVGSALLSEWVTGTALWGALTAAFISGGQLGGTFSMGLQRLQGTVAGALAGFVITFVAHEEPYATTTLIAAWVFLSAYVRTSPRNAYPGLTACYMGASAALGYALPQTLSEFALNRINDTAIAIVVVLVVEQLFWPQWSSRLVRQEVHTNLKAELESFMELEHTYTRENNLEKRHRTMEEVRVMEARMSASCVRQRSLVVEAGKEPQLWHRPFPAAQYVALIEIQMAMQRLLVILRRTLLVTGDVVLEEQLERLVGPLMGPLSALGGAVVDSMRELLAELEAGQTRGERANGAQEIVIEIEACGEGMRGSRGKERLRRETEVEIERRKEQAQAHTLRTKRKLVLAEYQERYEAVLSRLVAWRVVHPEAPVLSSSAALPFSTFVYATQQFCGQVEKLENTVRELIQEEHPAEMRSMAEIEAILGVEGGGEVGKQE